MKKLPPPPGNDPFIPLTKEQIDNYYDILFDKFTVQVKRKKEFILKKKKEEDIPIVQEKSIHEIIRENYPNATIKRSATYEKSHSVILSDTENKKEISDAEFIWVDLFQLWEAQVQWKNTQYIDIGQRKKFDEFEERIIKLYKKLFIPDETEEKKIDDNLLKDSDYNKAIAIFIEVKQDMNLLPKRLKKDYYEALFKEIGIKRTAGNISKYKSSLGERVEIIQYLNNVQKGNFTGYNILSRIPGSDVIIKHIKENWENQ
jgi:hypothetical protein